MKEIKHEKVSLLSIGGFGAGDAIDDRIETVKAKLLDARHSYNVAKAKLEETTRAYEIITSTPINRLNKSKIKNQARAFAKKKVSAKKVFQIHSTDRDNLTFELNHLLHKRKQLTKGEQYDRTESEDERTPEYDEVGGGSESSSSGGGEEEIREGTRVHDEPTYEQDQQEEPEEEEEEV